jgi:hypothetical protein
MTNQQRLKAAVKNQYWLRDELGADRSAQISIYATEFAQDDPTILEDFPEFLSEHWEMLWIPPLAHTPIQTCWYRYERAEIYCLQGEVQRVHFQTEQPQPQIVHRGGSNWYEWDPTGAVLIGANNTSIETPEISVDPQRPHQYVNRQPVTAVALIRYMPNVNSPTL